MGSGYLTAWDFLDVDAFGAVKAFIYSEAGLIDFWDRNLLWTSLFYFVLW
jgi:hypothetical protein